MRGLSVTDVAERVGVAAATLRAWERRYGIGPSARTTGGHRRYSNADVAALQRLQRLIRAGMPTGSAALLAFDMIGRDDSGGAVTAPDAAAAIAHGDRLTERFAAAVDSLDPDRIARAADVVLTDRGAVSAWTDVFMPQLQALGQRWEATGLGVEREHVAVLVLQTSLARHTRRQTRRDPRDRPHVLVAATPAEQHTLPLDALAAALAESRVRACVVGSLPELALHTAIEDTAPSVVVLWARSGQTTDSALLRGLLTRAPVVCAAGVGWRRSRLPRNVPHLPDLPSAVDTVLAWAT
ncbi:MAG: MerR family transcriptional regulator, light-induced transcriptional regulator [Pseudonocardiales bacterium]|nr:MerR family transcriptional regulator, light-induced transcriptional regulator [Pseudonocardiales bacterium]MDT4980101.1 MerR family transcriptional regulator, light-induced transcriptional regulator [Pseudonocardiales bacterium]